MKKARLILIFNKEINSGYDEESKINFDIILSNIRILISSFGWNRGWVNNKIIRYNNKKLDLFKVVLYLKIFKIFYWIF